MNTSGLSRLTDEHYTLGTPKRIELLESGHNDTYAAEMATSQYALRVYGQTKSWIRGESDMQFELDLLTHLHRQKAPVSYPLQRRDGGTLSRLSTPDGERFYALFSWAPGRPIDSEQLTLAEGRLLGSALAAIHVAADSFETRHSRYSIDEWTLLDRSMQRMRSTLQQADPADVRFIEEQVAQIRDHLRTFDPGPGGWGIIHADPQVLNSHVTPDGQVTFFDFDHCGYGWRAYDIAYCLRHTGPQFDRAAERIRAAVIEGYNAIRPISEAEYEMLPTLGRAAWIREGTPAGYGLPPTTLVKFLRDPYELWH